MIDGMKRMAHWHTDSFNAFPIGDGYEVEGNIFDFRDDNGICYDQHGVTVRHWRRAHTKDGAYAYRLDWKGLSFVWTGDGRPDALTTKLSQGVVVFVTELQPDLGNLTSLKFGLPALMTNVTIDQAHTPHYAAGYMFAQVQPRLAMCTHLTYDEAEVPEMIAGIRTHWEGLFQFGAPDVVVVNVTKDAIWTRKAALPDSAMPAMPSAAEAAALFDLKPPMQMKVRFPNPRHTVADIKEPFVREQEFDPTAYYPADVFLAPHTAFPDDFKIVVLKMAGTQIAAKAKVMIRDAVDRVSARLNGNEARQIARRVVQSLTAVNTTAGLLGIVRDFARHSEDDAVLDEILADPKAVNDLLAKAEELERVFAQVQAFDDPIKQAQALGKALKQS